MSIPDEQLIAGLLEANGIAATPIEQQGMAIVLCRQRSTVDAMYAVPAGEIETCENSQKWEYLDA